MDKKERQERRFTQDQIEAASQVNLIAYTTSKGYGPVKVSGNAYKLPGYGGLFLKGDGTKWNWFSQNKGGGPIQFLMEMESLTWVEAIKELLCIEDQELPYVPRQLSCDEDKGELVLPQKNDTYRHLFAYLIQSRGIDQSIVTTFVDKKLIYEDEKRNCVFVGYKQDGQPGYASLRSTRTMGDSFRGDVRNSDKSYGFSWEGGDHGICVFEAPIDLLSYLSLLKLHGIESFDHHLISLGGVTDKALDYYLAAHSEINKIILCLDNDPAGHEAAVRIQKKYGECYQILRHTPKNKDFNEDLIQVKKNLSVMAREPPVAYEVLEEDMEMG